MWAVNIPGNSQLSAISAYKRAHALVSHNADQPYKKLRFEDRLPNKVALTQRILRLLRTKYGMDTENVILTVTDERSADAALRGLLGNKELIEKTIQYANLSNEMAEKLRVIQKNVSQQLGYGGNVQYLNKLPIASLQNIFATLDGVSTSFFPKQSRLSLYGDTSTLSAAAGASGATPLIPSSSAGPSGATPSIPSSSGASGSTAAGASGAIPSTTDASGSTAPSSTGAAGASGSTPLTTPEVDWSAAEASGSTPAIPSSSDIDLSTIIDDSLMRDSDTGESSETREIAQQTNLNPDLEETGILTDIPSSSDIDLSTIIDDSLIDNESYEEIDIRDKEEEQKTEEDKQETEEGFVTPQKSQQKSQVKDTPMTNMKRKQQEKKNKLFDNYNVRENRDDKTFKIIEKIDKVMNSDMSSLYKFDKLQLLVEKEERKEIKNIIISLISNIAGDAFQELASIENVVDNTNNLTPEEQQKKLDTLHKSNVKSRARIYDSSQRRKKELEQLVERNKNKKVQRQLSFENVD